MMGRKRGTRVIVAEDRPLTEEEAALAAEAAAYAASDADYTQYEEAAAADALGPPPSLAEAIAALEACGDAEKALGAAAYHKVDRRYLGVSVPLIEDMARLWRAQATLEERIALADGLWHSDIHEAKIAAAKLLTQARIRPDDAVWRTIVSWVPGFDAWAAADHACNAGGRRLVGAPERLDEIETWLDAENMWTRRAALVITLPFTKSNHPDAVEQAARARVLGWCVRLAPDRDWFIQKAIGWWLRELSKHDAAAVRNWLAEHGTTLKPFARKEASKYLK
ncbi:DNA alkylation repair protein [Rhodobacter capsulatus]|uniref:3-methyladenine DNA glycosylase AlkD n=1 Tax=Rhodobacter capsulatus TaxID=1061 RepID=A0A1G7JXN9_RHOCA|nr:DNA alkylation repair protein [Rhodobacter capsulatus]WER07962.1 DNA alkylation repair protein [Rhodobacter capsulatus]SDF29670.1 3-methyladenine DNA glycosylase AlkD [Rhodobacter capsulatus]